MSEPTGLTGKQVLITGAGCLGSVIVHRFTEAGASVRVFDRSTERLAALDDGVTPIQGDITDRNAVEQAVDGCDILVHTAALLGGSMEEQQRVNVTGTGVVMESAAAAGVSRAVHISSIAVYGIGCKGDITEAMGPNPSRQAYSMTKAGGEEAVRASGVPHAIIRPAGIFGPGAEYFTGSYFQRARRKPIIFVGRGKGALAVVFVEDVADLAVVVAQHPAAEAEAFNCAIHPPPTHREYMHAYVDLVGNHSWVGIPMPLVLGASWLAVPFAKKYSYARQLPQNLAFVNRYVRYSTDKARDLLEWKPAVGVHEGISRAVPWLAEQGLLEQA